MADVTARARAAQAPLAAVRPVARAGAGVWALSGAAMVLVLLAPAIWNGFPFIFPDTGGYVTRPMDGDLAMGRSALYGLFLYLGIPFAFWPNIVIQAAVTVWLVVLTLRVTGLGGRPWLALGVVTMLTVATGLPWYAGQLMPDILFSSAALALFLLVFGQSRISRMESIGLAAVIALAIPSHMAAAGLCLGVLAALWLISKLPRIHLPTPRLQVAALAVAAGIALSPLSNAAITGTLSFTPGGVSFLFGRLIEDGIVARYLDERCPDPALRLCTVKHEIPDEADAWLWGDGTAFYRLGGWQGLNAEQKAIILDSLQRYPLMHLETAITASVGQMLRFGTELAIHTNGPTIETFRERVPQWMPALMRAEQQRKSFEVAPLNVLHVPVAALAIIGLGAVLLMRRRWNIPPTIAALCATVLLALAVNAVVCGVFSHPVDRYQSRLVWLAPFAFALVVASRYGRPPAATRLGAPSDLA